MQIDILVLTKNECLELMKILPLVSLREIAISENKLAKKYIMGFRPVNAPVNLLATMYYQEIHINNTKVKTKLQEIWDGFCEKTKLDVWLQEVSKVETIGDYIKIGSEYAKLQIGLKVSILCKVLNLDIESNKVDAIQKCVDEFTSYIDEMAGRVKCIEEKEERNIKEINRLSREKEVAIQKKDVIAQELEKLRRDYEKELQKVRRELVMWQDKSGILDERVKDLLILKDECSLQIEELKRNRTYLEDEVRLLQGDIEKKQKEIQVVQTNIEKMTEDMSSLQKEKELEYTETLNRLVEGTIADLKIDYSLDIKQIREIMNDIEGSHDIISVWKYLSALNLEKMVDVEISMSNDLVDIEVLDACDEIENNILLKYIILKSIKSLLFEFMSAKEKNISIAQRFSENTERK